MLRLKLCKFKFMFLYFCIAPLVAQDSIRYNRPLHSSPKGLYAYSYMYIWTEACGRKAYEVSLLLHEISRSWEETGGRKKRHNIRETNGEQSTFLTTCRKEKNGRAGVGRSLRKVARQRRKLWDGNVWTRAGMWWRMEHGPCWLSG